VKDTLLMIVVGTVLAAPAAAQVAAQPDPLEARVTIDYRSAAAADS